MLSKKVGLGLYALILLSSCMSDHTMDGMESMNMPPAVLVIPASKGPFETVLARDINPDAKIVEILLEAKKSQIELIPGKSVEMWTYNGMFPGPRIEAMVGDTVRIRFKNSLTEPTTIHWHGLRVPAEMDGVPATQNPIQPGDSFIYEFTVQDAGTFWYHPHVRSEEQVERGLYGSFVVHDINEPVTTTDRVIILDDVLVNKDGKLEEFKLDQAMPGRQGNLILTNGRAHPIVPMTTGGLHRFRFINTANARYFLLSLPGKKIIQIGTDGGLMKSPKILDQLLLVPGERADVVVVSDGDTGEVNEWKSLKYDRGHETGKLPDVTIFQVINDGDRIVTPVLPNEFNIINQLPEANVYRTIKLEESNATNEHAGHGSGNITTGPVFSINGQTYPNATPLKATLNSVEDWTVENTTEMDHPFHLHGFRFQIISINNINENSVSWRDTINIGAMSSVKFRVKLEQNPGQWMFHCHILEHAERGMMGTLEVRP
jgi:FtsP/CotA-like multicopper oxidase with cupredoxin domain